MLVSEFDYELPKSLIAQEPLPERDQSRLLVLERRTGRIHDARFQNIVDWLVPGDLLVVNNTRVIPARVLGRLDTGGRAELLLVRNLELGVWSVLVRPGRRVRQGTRIRFDDYEATVLESRRDGTRIVRFTPADVTVLLERQGELPLPPYIRKKCEQPDRYQTVYASRPGAVAAPTAGLHFTPAVLEALERKGVETASLTLHVGPGTFRPVKTTTVEEHQMHPERFELPDSTARQVNNALEQGRRVVCCGTTTVRVLESRAGGDSRTEDQKPGFKPGQRRVQPGEGETNLYIFPGYEWKVTGALLTNFHLPKSTLLMLVCAFGGKENLMRAYKHAVSEQYRFYSFGDAMLIV